MHCSLCREAVKAIDELRDGNEKTPFSGKTAYEVINYLAKTAKPPLNDEQTGQFYSHMCKNCFDDILAYDGYMIKLMQIQKRILSSLRKPRSNETYVEILPLEEPMDDLKMEKIEISEYVNENETNYNYLDNEINTARKYDDFEDGKYESKQVNTIDKSITSKRAGVLHKAKKIWKCEICGVTKKDEEYLELHKNVHEGKSDLECRYCNKRYTRKIHVLRHMQKHWNKKKFQCERCGLRFSEEPIYYNHRLQHEAEEDPLICSVCNQSFKTRRTYRNHLLVHREDRPRYSCEICGKKFVEKYTLKVHLRSHNDKNAENGMRRGRKINDVQQEEKNIECIICGDQFSSQDICDEHKKVRHDVILKNESIFI